jgi:hypothetical protein
MPHSTRNRRTLLTFAAVLALPLLSGCGDNGPKLVGTTDADYHQESGVKNQGKLFDSDLTLFGTGKGKGNAEGTGIGVNAYLWRGALDTLSFMPLASADPFGGVIITDWYQPPASPGERFKATAYILGRQLRSDAVRVSLFRQVIKGSTWVDAEVAPQTTTDIENKVLARARELRAAVAAAQN